VLILLSSSVRVMLSRYEFQQLAEDRFQLAHGLFLLVVIVFEITLILQVKEAGHAFLVFNGHYCYVIIKQIRSRERSQRDHGRTGKKGVP
jgi:hypothetical protein